MRGLLTSVALGVLLAGPLAAISLAMVPASWRGPAIPASALAASIMLIILLRHVRKPPP